MATLAIASAHAAAQGPRFEGIVTFQQQGSVELRVSISGAFMRVEMLGLNGNQAVFLGDSSSTAIVFLSPQMHQYMKVDWARFGQLRSDSAARSKFIITNTTRVDTVAGEPCEIWHVEGSIYSYDVCGARNFARPVLENVPGTLGQPPRSGLGFPTDFFALRVGGKVGPPVLLATKIERKKLDPSIFKIPEGYTGADMTGIKLQIQEPGTSPGGANPPTAPEHVQPARMPEAQLPPPRGDAHPVPPAR
jgi:hypothetical protein